MCTRKLITGCDVGLGDVDLGVVILHLHLLHVACLLDRELDGRCHEVAFGRDGLGEHVAARLDANDAMSGVGRYPFLDDVAVLIGQHERCTRQFFASCRVGLGDIEDGRRVFERKLKGVAELSTFHI